MAQPLRLEFAGALYHVTSRGDRREDIYESNEDREGFLSILGDNFKAHNWVCHAYCLMSNHYRLLIETPDANLSKGMRQLNGVYTQYYNRRHSRVGHVFQGRSKAILVGKNSYLLELARYIVLNPVRAAMVPAARDWHWSSYLATAGERRCPEWLNIRFLLAAFGTKISLATENYRIFVAEGNHQPSPWQNLQSQIYLGDEVFVNRMLNRISSDEELTEIPSSQRRPQPGQIKDYERQAPSRDGAIVGAYASGGFSMKEIGEHFGLHYSRVSRIVAKAKSKT